MRHLPKPVPPLICNVLMPAGKLLASAFSVGRAFHLARKLTASFSDCIERLLEEQGRFNFGTVRAGQESLQAEIKPSGFTRLGSDCQRVFLVNNHGHKQLTQWSPLNGDSLDRPYYFSAVPILKNSAANLDPVAAQELVASLFEREGFVLFDLLETWWPHPLFVMFEEELIARLNPLADILYGLRSNKLPERITLAPLGNVGLKLGTAQMLFPHPVVPFVNGNAGVINYPSGINCPLQVSIPLVAVELKLHRFHVTIVQHNSVHDHEKAIRFQDRGLGARSP